MADGRLYMIIQSADFDQLNVQPGDVLKGKLYVGRWADTRRGDRGSGITDTVPGFEWKIESSGRKI